MAKCRVQRNKPIPTYSETNHAINYAYYSGEDEPLTDTNPTDQYAFQQWQQLEVEEG